MALAEKSTTASQTDSNRPDLNEKTAPSGDDDADWASVSHEEADDNVLLQSGYTRQSYQGHLDLSHALDEQDAFKFRRLDTGLSWHAMLPELSRPPNSVIERRHMEQADSG
ncbi:hypothetical protein PRZ48_005712 [Zasmidium cellare]|uniref:Uncharacterized protein n=1 Tax=Zasmidium cellare TaxID=395010 RepID=A0ABR0ELC9_ZASCE|nr:hypothetical protein PRZ48_005712 [Zasmidium cellare]